MTRAQRIARVAKVRALQHKAVESRLASAAMAVSEVERRMTALQNASDGALCMAKDNENAFREHLQLRSALVGPLKDLRRRQLRAAEEQGRWMHAVRTADASCQLAVRVAEMLCNEEDRRLVRQEQQRLDELFASKTARHVVA